MVDVLPVAPIIEERGGGVDVDARLGRVARQPAQPLHRDRELPRAVAPGPVLSASIVSLPRMPSGLSPEFA